MTARVNRTHINLLERNVVVPAGCRCGRGSRRRSVCGTGEFSRCRRFTRVFVRTASGSGAYKVHLSSLYFKCIATFAIAVGPLFDSKSALNINRTSLRQIFGGILSLVPPEGVPKPSGE